MSDAVMRRRSIRRFTDEEVSQEELAKVLDAGAAAPSALFKHPVRFIILSREELDRIASRVEQKTPFVEGRVGVATVADTRNYGGGTGWLEDCAAAMENMLIEATELGLGSLWYGVYRRAAKEPQIREILALPEGVEVCGIVILGHSAEKKEPHGAADPKLFYSGKWHE